MPLRKLASRRLKKMSGAPSDFLRIARVLKSYGTEGEILVGFRELGPEDLNLKEPVFIMFDGLPVPFFIESLKEKGTSKALLRITGVANLKDAEELAGKEIFAKKSAIIPGDGDDEVLDIEDLLGWTLQGKDGEKIGEIFDFEPIPGNPCLYVEVNGETIMVPIHDDLIIDIDEEEQTLTFDLPEGLI